MNPPLATPLAPPPDARRLELDAEVHAFLETLKREQASYLHAIAAARGQLGGDHGQLAHVTAIQGRLTRQFFDAQRLIMQRRAEVDAEVARIATETEEHANVVLAAAVANATLGSFPPPSADDRHDAPEDADTALERSTRQALTALSVLAVRTRTDALAIEQVINDAFQPAEPDGVRAERELQRLLDEWWEHERSEGSALVEDARARAAMRLHLAHLEACEIAGNTPTPLPVPTVEPTPVPAPPASRSLLPAALLEALDDASPDQLDAVLASMSASLVASAPASTVARTDNGDVLFRLERAVAARPDDAQPATGDHFERFWTTAESATDGETPELSWRGVFWRVVFPITAVTSGLAVLMAVVG